MVGWLHTIASNRAFSKFFFGLVCNTSLQGERVMIRFLSVLMVAFLVLIQSVPTTATTELILVPAPSLNPNATYANAWAAAGNPITVDHPCGPSPYLGVKGANGAKVTCGPKSRQSGSDRADAYAEAKIVNGTATVNAWVTVPKPIVFAAGASYAKANASIPAVDSAGLLFGLNLSYLTKGNLKLQGQAEPVDITYISTLSDCGPNELSPDLKRILDKESVVDLHSEGFTFCKPGKEYVRLEISLIGDEKGKIRINREVLSGNVAKCEKGYEKNEKRKEPCIIDDLQPLSEKNFDIPEIPCEGSTGRCGKYAVVRELTRDAGVNLYFPFTGKEESLSVDELVCSKSREVQQPRPAAHRDICNLNLHPKSEDHNNPS
jgi:hypothetical protein